MTVHPLLNEEPRTLTSVVTESGVHSDKVLDWRECEFERLGFPEFEASALAATRIDTHDMESLIGRGCSRELAWRILTGTMWSGSDPLWVESPEGGYMELPSTISVDEDEDEDDGA